MNRKLTSNGFEIDMSPSHFGWLNDSSDLLDNDIALCERMAKDGYLYLPNYIDVISIRKARDAVFEDLVNESVLDENCTVEEIVPKNGIEMRLRTDICNKKDSAAKIAIDQLTGSSRILTLLCRLLGGPVKRFEWMWLRAMTPGKGTAPHCDIVFMGRGTTNIYTAWIPLGNINLQVGGLIILEGSHRCEILRKGYCTMDVDAICTNMNNQSQPNAAGYPGYGAIALDITQLQKELNCRLLTAREYKMGDFVIFSAYTVHGSLDNLSREIRLSVDTRYQLESESIDERWATGDPSTRVVKNMIC